MVVVNKASKMAPCQQACPAEIDVPRYIRAVQKGDFDLALAVIREKIPFPSVCGYACMHPCEAKCNMNLIDNPIAIRALKRVAAEKGSLSKIERISRKTGKNVAVLGSGPAGLTGAYYLAKLGHTVTVFEANSEPGGMMRQAIPEYRLPKNILDSEIKIIKETGIELKTNTRIESMTKLREQRYDAVLLATGAPQSVKMGIEGEDLAKIIDGLSLLRQVKEGEKVKLGGKICVVGGKHSY